MAPRSTRTDALCQDWPITRYGPRYPRRTQGFGKQSATRSVSYSDSQPINLMFHFAWEYLTPDDRACVITLPLMRAYAHMRRDASARRTTISAYLQSNRQAPEIEPPLDHFRSWFMGAALLSFDFDYGDLVRWLDGEYTDAGRDFLSITNAIQEVRGFPTPKGYPPMDYNRAQRIVTEGVPLRANYSCPRRDTLRRLAYDNHPPLATQMAYDNHPPLATQMADVRKKFGKEEVKSLHLALPKFVAWFLPGLMISPLSWVIRKGKGRIVVDSSSKLGENDKGNTNAQIPKQGTAGREDECPPVYYGNAMPRALSYIWNLRIDHPMEEILMHVDDIDAAFRRIVYHPDAAMAFAYVFAEFLIIPVGQIFGSRNSPSFWCIPAELRAHCAACLDYSDRPFEWEADMTFPDPPTEAEIATFVPAVRDALHQGIPKQLDQRMGHFKFVDDNLAVATANRIVSALRGAMGSANDIIANPNDHRRPQVLSKEKWGMNVSHREVYLGLILDTRKLCVEWPPDKVAELRAICRTWLDQSHGRSPKDFAQMLGLVRNAGQVLPLGLFYVLQIQFLLNEAIGTTASGLNPRALRNWWQRHRIHIPREAMAHIELLHQATLNPTIWERPIGLLIQREPTCIALSDAAYTGMGGWSPELKFYWRLTRDDLVKCGFNMREIDLDNERAADSAKGTDELHINSLDFVGVIINLWFSLVMLAKLGPIRGGHALLLRADNTTAISLFKHSARSRRTALRNLCLLCALRNLCLLCEALLAVSNTANTIQILINHI